MPTNHACNIFGPRGIVSFSPEIPVSSAGSIFPGLATESTDTRTANLLDIGRDLTALIHNEILESSRGGEDFINDTEYLR